MSCTTTHTATNEAMPAVVYHPYHRDFGTHPLPTDRSALLNEQREYKTYVTNYQTDVWDVERGGADEDFYGCIERLNALDAAIAQLPPDNSDEAMVDACVQAYRIYCPFKDKDDAKWHGARWSPKHKTWYAPCASIYGELAKWHKPTDKPQKTIGKRSNFPGGKTADKAWTTMLANDAAEEAPQLAPPAPVLVKKYIKRGARWWAVYV